MRFTPSEFRNLESFPEFAKERNQLIYASLVNNESSICIIDTRLPSRYNLTRVIAVEQVLANMPYIGALQRHFKQTSNPFTSRLQSAGLLFTIALKS